MLTYFLFCVCYYRFFTGVWGGWCFVVCSATSHHSHIMRGVACAMHLLCFAADSNRCITDNALWFIQKMPCAYCFLFFLGVFLYCIFRLLVQICNWYLNSKSGVPLIYEEQKLWSFMWDSYIVTNRWRARFVILSAHCGLSLFKTTLISFHRWILMLS